MALSKILPASQEQYVGSRNIIINGSMQVAQRGTSFTSSSVNEYSLDRWRTEGYSLSTVISQQSFTAGQTDVPDFPTNYVRVTTNAAIPSGQFWSFQQRIEKPQAIPVGTQNFTLSFWAKSVSGTISATAFSFGISNDKVDCPEITTSWQKITTTINCAVSSSNAYESMYLVHLGSGKAAISIDIANVQLEIGNSSTPFEHESFAETLQKCMRYFETSYAYGTALGSSGGTTNMPARAAVGTNDTAQEWDFEVTKRASPSVTIYGSSGSSGQAYNFRLGANVSANVENGAGRKCFRLYRHGGSSWSSNDWIAANYAVDAEL
jgi:hypothetical protein